MKFISSIKNNISSKLLLNSNISNSERGELVVIEKDERGKFYKSLLRLGAVFIIAFLLILLVLNFGNIFGSAKNSIDFKLSEQQRYEQMTQLYRSMYGYGSGYPDSGFSRPISGTTQYDKPKVDSSYALSSEPQNSYDNAISIPKIGVTAPIIITNTTDPKTLLTQLEKGVIIYPESSTPGKAGTTVIIGHSSSNSLNSEYGRVFSKLNNLTAGDQIFVNFGGKEYIYTIRTKKIGSVDQLASIGINNDLIVGTCWPIGTDKERIIIGADLIK